MHNLWRETLLGHDFALMEQDPIAHAASGRRQSLDAMLLMLTCSAAAKRVMLATSISRILCATISLQFLCRRPRCPMPSKIGFLQVHPQFQKGRPLTKIIITLILEASIPNSRVFVWRGGSNPSDKADTEIEPLSYRVDHVRRQGNGPYEAHAICFCWGEGESTQVRVYGG